MICLSGINKSYNTGALRLPVLRDVSLQIQRGEFVAIMGQSGSGKTTLLNIIGCLDTFDDGSYRFAGEETAKLDRVAQARLRGKHLGFVFQSFNLIPRMTTLRNVELPMIYAGMNRQQRQQHAAEQLRRVGLAERSEHLPTQLSGGQQQRVAIARALVNDPDVIIADEPTGSLDSQTGEEIMHLFTQLHAAGKTIVMVTHETSIAGFASRLVLLQDGQIVSDGGQA